MKLQRRVPAHIVTLEFKWLQKDFCVMSQQYKAIREKFKNPMLSCVWCKHKFIDGEIIALGCSNKGNKVLCQKCATELEESKP